MGDGRGADWRAVRCIAHRCGGLLAAENSLAGLRAAAAAGYRAVEFDVMLSADGTPWLIHDDTLERTSDSQGAVGRLPDAVLARVAIGRERSRDAAVGAADAGSAAAVPGEPLPRFAEALALCSALGLLANIEIKPFPGQDARTGEAVARLAGDSSLPVPAMLLSSFSGEALAAARRAAPHLARALLFEEVPANWAAQVDAPAAVAIHCSAGQRDWSWLPQAKARGLAVRCYTVNDSAAARRLLASGVDAVFTDAVGTLQLD